MVISVICIACQSNISTFTIYIIITIIIKFILTVSRKSIKRSDIYTVIYTSEQAFICIDAKTVHAHGGLSSMQ